MKRLFCTTLICGLAIMSTGCDLSALTDLQNATLAKDVMQTGRSNLGDVISTFRGLGIQLVTAAFVGLAYYTWYKLQKGEAPKGVIIEHLFYTVIALYIAIMAGGPRSIEQGIYTIGQDLAAYTGATSLDGGSIMPLQCLNAGISTAGKIPKALGVVAKNDLAGVTDPLGLQLKQSVEAWLLANTSFGSAVAAVANAAAIYFMRMVMWTTFAFLSLFYWAIAPLIAWTLLLPQTRPVFKGFILSYISLNLWPLLMGLMERIGGAVICGTFAQAQLRGDPLTMMSLYTAIHIKILVLNLVWLMGYLAIPLVAAKMVQGAVRTAVH
jgi:hypothetical protein